METVILAGGFGTRMKPLTYTRPKVMLPILDKPMIEYIIDTLPKEITTVIIAANYRVDDIIRYFDIHKKNKKIIINKESIPLGTGGAVKFAEKYLGDTFLVLNSDIVSSINLADFIAFHKHENATVSISLWPVENVTEYGVVKIEGNRIKYFVEKPKREDAPSNLINAGTYCINRIVLDYIETDKLVSMEKNIFPKVIADNKMFIGYRFSGYWIDVGRHSDYLAAHRLLLDAMKKKTYLGNNVDIESKTQMDYVVVHTNTVIGKGSKIKNSIVLENSEIDENVIMENSIVGANCMIGKNTKIINSIIGDNHIIPENTIIRNERYWKFDIPYGYPEKQIGNVIEE